MKILLLAIGLTLLASCKKDQKDCSCGFIKSDDATDYSIIIRNECSDNSKKFYLTAGDWMNAHPGDYYCISNVTSW